MPILRAALKALPATLTGEERRRIHQKRGEKTEDANEGLSHPSESSEGKTQPKATRQVHSLQGQENPKIRHQDNPKEGHQ